MRLKFWLCQQNHHYQKEISSNNTQTSFQHLKASLEQNKQPGKAIFTIRPWHTQINWGPTIWKFFLKCSIPNSLLLKQDDTISPKRCTSTQGLVVLQRFNKQARGETTHKTWIIVNLVVLPVSLLKSLYYWQFYGE